LGWPEIHRRQWLLRVGLASQRRRGTHDEMHGQLTVLIQNSLGLSCTISSASLCKAACIERTVPGTDWPTALATTLSGPLFTCHQHSATLFSIPSSLQLPPPRQCLPRRYTQMPRRPWSRIQRDSNMKREHSSAKAASLSAIARSCWAMSISAALQSL
jgi:hypothetical protein